MRETIKKTALTIFFSIFILVIMLIGIGVVQKLTGVEGLNRFDQYFGEKIPPTAVKTTTIQVRVSSSEDDAEQGPSEVVSLSSSDLELVVDDDGQQVVGMLFRELPIPQGATILSAHVQFKVDETSTDPSSLAIQVETADDPAPYQEVNRNLSNRPLTSTVISWEPPAWSTEGAAGPDQQTPDLSPLIQEVVDRNGWAPGNSLALIIQGTGTRTAESFDGDPSGTALLQVTFEGEPATGDSYSGSPTPVSPESSLRIAVIGDFGDGDRSEARVAALVNSWNPDLIVTTGDNNYFSGKATTIDENIGRYYSPYIGNYQGSYGPGSDTNRFWPILGNHDWLSISCGANGCQGPHFDYFTLPGNERYYAVDFGLVQLFALDTNPDEPDGNTPDSRQASWLRNSLAASSACFNLVFSHHPPYSTGYHGSSHIIRWPFQEWGADAVISGHEHSYERLEAGGYPYFVNGSGGRNLRGFPNIDKLPPGVTSMGRYKEDYGAMLITADRTGITFQFYDASNLLIDEFRMMKDCQINGVLPETNHP